MTRQVIINAQTHSGKNRTRPAKKQALAKRPSPAPPAAKDETELALQKLFATTSELEDSWRSRSSLSREMAAQLSVDADHAQAVVKKDLISDSIGRMVKPYKDAIYLYTQALERERNPLANSYTSAERERDVEEIKALKQRYYREYDDPITRDQLRAQIDLRESLMRSSHAHQNDEEDPFAKKVRQRKIDVNAKKVLRAYGLENEWPEKALTAVNDVLNVGSRISASVGQCLKEPDSCSTLATIAAVSTEASMEAIPEPNFASRNLDARIW